MTDYPCLPSPRPPGPARQHCRHYGYAPGLVDGGPTCAVGVNNRQPGGSAPCMPDGTGCPSRSDWTEEERAAWKAYGDERLGRMAVIMPTIPGSADRKHREEWGKDGVIDCPACGVGKVSWSRARSNGHLWARCSTPDCFSVIQEPCQLKPGRRSKPLPKLQPIFSKSG